MTPARLARLEAGLSVHAVAARLGVTPKYVERLERQPDAPCWSPRTVRNAAALYGCNPADLDSRLCADWETLLAQATTSSPLHRLVRALTACNDAFRDQRLLVIDAATELLCASGPFAQRSDAARHVGLAATQASYQLNILAQAEEHNEWAAEARLRPLPAALLATVREEAEAAVERAQDALIACLAAHPEVTHG